MKRDELYRIPLGRGGTFRVLLSKKETDSVIITDEGEEETQLWPGNIPPDEYLPYKRLGSGGSGPPGGPLISVPPTIAYDHIYRQQGGPIGYPQNDQVNYTSCTATLYYVITTGNYFREVERSYNGLYGPDDSLSTFWNAQLGSLPNMLLFSPVYGLYRSHTEICRVRERTSPRAFSPWVNVVLSFPATAYASYIGDLDAYYFTNHQIESGQQIP